jgi:hypothetical protein
MSTPTPTPYLPSVTPIPTTSQPPSSVTPLPTPGFATPFYLDLLTYWRNKQDETDKLVEKARKFKTKDEDDEKKEKDTECPNPESPPLNKAITSTSDLLKAMGADNPCAKSAAFKASMEGGGSSASGGIAGGFVGSYEESESYAKTDLQNQSRERGCGTYLANASNIVEKQNVMQCILNKCMNKASVVGRAGASVMIRTLPLSAEEKQNLMKLQADRQEYDMKADLEIMKTVSSLAKDLTPSQMKELRETYANIKKLNLDTYKLALESYSRDIVIKDSTIRVTSSVDINTKISLTTDVQNKLTSLSESVSKDIANMLVQNELGVGAQDPNVRNAVDKNSDKQKTDVSKNIQNITNNTQISADANGNIVIEAPGKIAITNTTIEANAVAKVVLEQVMKQAIVNGMDIASKTLNDKATTQSVVNKVKGLEDLQRALNEGADIATKGATAATGGSKKILLLIAILVVGFLVFKMIRGGSSFGRRTGEREEMLEMIMLILIVFYLCISIYRFFQHRG